MIFGAMLSPTRISRLITLAVLCLLFESVTYAQIGIPHNWHKCTARLTAYQRFGNVDSVYGATGFFLQDTVGGNPRMYLVTNRHVLMGRDSVRLHYEAVSGNIEESCVQLKSSTNLYFHPDTTVDLAMLFVHNLVKTYAIEPERILSSAFLKADFPVYFFGFPQGRTAGCADTVIPILEQAFVLKLFSNNIVLSGFAYGGNSGSPVLLDQRVSPSYFWRLIGVVWGKYSNPYAPEFGYAAAVPAERLLQLVKFVRESNGK